MVHLYYQHYLSNSKRLSHSINKKKNRRVSKILMRYRFLIISLVTIESVSLSLMLSLVPLSGFLGR